VLKAPRSLTAGGEGHWPQEWPEETIAEWIRQIPDLGDAAREEFLSQGSSMSELMYDYEQETLDSTGRDAGAAGAAAWEAFERARKACMEGDRLGLVLGSGQYSRDGFMQRNITGIAQEVQEEMAAAAAAEVWWLRGEWRNVEAVRIKARAAQKKEDERIKEQALRAFAESVGMPVDAMWEGVAQGEQGEIVEIDWHEKDLKGTLPVGDMHMPNLRKLNLRGNKTLKGDISTLGLPESMKYLLLCDCIGLTSDISARFLPARMTHLSLYGCTGLAGKTSGFVESEGHTLPYI
jgi:hypothetical protein